MLLMLFSFCSFYCFSRNQALKLGDLLSLSHFRGDLNIRFLEGDVVTLQRNNGGEINNKKLVGACM